MINLIVLNRTDYLHKNGFGVKYPTMVDMPQNPTNQPTNQPSNYSVYYNVVGQQYALKKHHILNNVAT